MLVQSHCHYIIHALIPGNTSASAARTLRPAQAQALPARFSYVYARRCDPGTEGVFSNLEMARRKFDNVRLAPDGKMVRDVPSPRGTLEDTQTLVDTPHKQHKAWLYHTGATTGAAAERRKLNSKAISNVHKKAKAADKSGEPVRESLAVRALLAGIHLGPLGEGPERLKAQNAFSQEVRRAEQTVLKRDALNASQKAYAQVTICVRFCIARPVHTFGCP